MSKSSCCGCCSLCCCRRRENKSLILPPYTQVHERVPAVFQSHQRQQQTLTKIKKLVHKQEKVRETEKVEQQQQQQQQPNFLLPFRRKYTELIIRKWSGSGGSKSRRASACSVNLMEMETDLDAVAKDTEPVKKNEDGRQVTPSKRFSLKHGRASMEGGLMKFTNLMKGYRFRWVVLNDEEGYLQYYESKELKKGQPKGCIYLGSAKVTTKKGELTFIVSSVNGKIFKLKAYDDRQKQLWIERIRAAAEYHTRKLGEPEKCTTKSAMSTVVSVCEGTPCINTPQSWKKDLTVRKKMLLSESYVNAKENFREADDFFKHLDSKILELPTSGMYMNSLDADLLLLKAMSAATLQGVQDCIYLLELASVQLEQSTSPRSSVARSSHHIFPNILDASVWSLPNPADEVPDEGLFADNELSKMDDHKTIIVHLLSQLKLGMDLTKVVLPTFVLEKRSLLELFTDCMAHPDMFIRITSFPDPEKRFLAVLEWYLFSFHSGGLGTSAKKPYNPIIGETFHCSWRVPGAYAMSKEILLTYTAEQVSHHPPVTAFYVECPERRITMNSSIYTKSKFMGMSMGVSLIGKVLLHLASHDEDYVFSLPSAYARSILTVPWVELGDKIQLTCESTGYTANIVFHTKPFIGGKLHHVTAEAKNQKTGKVFCKVVGEWNAMFQFTYPGSGIEAKTIDVNTLKVYLKYVRPLEKQKEYESRKLWHEVTEALSKQDMQKATEHKANLENIQREEEQRRKELRVEYEAKFFRNVNGVWLYKTLPDSFAIEAKK